MMMTDQHRGRAAILRTFVFLIAWLVMAGWGLSSVRALVWMPWLGVGGLVAAGFLMIHWAGSGRNLRLGLAEPLGGWPFILVGGIILVSALAYAAPVMLDSLTYRLPRLHLWIQDGHVGAFFSAEDRLNYMPQSWGLATLPLVQLAGDRLVWFWNFVSWLILYLLAFDWAFDINGEIKKSRILAFIGSTSTLAVLQAGSSANDLFALVMALLALRFVVNFERTRDGWEINWAVLSFCLAAGTKPHYAVFGLPLTLWFVFSPAKPWRAFRWVWAPFLLVVWLLCSPVPSFVLNYQTYGTWAGPGQNQTIKGKGPGWNLLLGTTMLLWQTPQPPVNPLAVIYGKKIDQTVADSGLNKLVPRFNLAMSPISLVDSASLGLVTSGLLVMGVILALRRNPQRWRSWPALAMLAGLVSIGMAMSHFVSGSSGRAYCGFFYFALPLAMIGWNSLRLGFLQWALYLSLFSSLLVLVLNPGRPLWPAQWAQYELAASPRFSWLAEKLEPYLVYQQRSVTAAEIVQAIPPDEQKVLVLVGEDRPLLPLFRPYDIGRKVLFLNPHALPAALNHLDVNYVIVGGGAQDVYPELCDYLENVTNYSLVISRDYTSKLVRGPEPWKLYRKNSAANAASLPSQ
jgi:hypothetical protein